MVRVAKNGITIRAFRTPVTLNWTFLLLVAFISFLDGRTLPFRLMFAAVVLVGIVWHEAGHAVAFALIGRRSRIIVHGLGGFTIPEDQRELTDTQGIGVSLAGPLSGMVVGLVALWLQIRGVGQHTEWSYYLISDLILVNLGWGVINLIPVIPLDGGHVMERLAGLAAPRLRATLPYLISVGVAVPAAIVAWEMGYGLAGLFALAFAALNLRLMTEARAAAQVDAADRRADAALELLATTPIDAAVPQVRAALGSKLSPDGYNRVATALAWALAWRMGPYDDTEVAQLVSHLAGRADTAFLAAAAAHHRGATAEARALLTRAFAVESTPPPEWLLRRLLPTRHEVADVAAWIDQLGLAERHNGLSRLTASLEAAGRPTDAAAVRSLMARPPVPA
jgi:Zn-dependent protease/plasmid stability protein